MKALGFDLVTPMGPLQLPIAQLADEAFESVWPKMQTRLREEMARERKVTLVLAGVVVATVLGTSYLLGSKR